MFSDKADIVPGYDFLVNSVWPETIKGVEGRIPSLFNPGNPDAFYEVKNKKQTHTLTHTGTILHDSFQLFISTHTSSLTCCCKCK